MKLVLVMPEPPDEGGDGQVSRILEDYGLDSVSVDIRFPDETACRGLDRKRRWQLRDTTAIRLADLVAPVSIRPDGRLRELVQSVDPGVEVCNDFRVAWDKSCWTPRYSFSGLTLRPRPEGEWLIHWTRASQGPWPGERIATFFAGMLGNPAVYARSAGATLARILTEGLIRGSGWKMPGVERAVAFTALTPPEVLPLMRWRARFVRYTFEPYGIAIRRDALAGLGARVVAYRGGNGAENEDRLFIHAEGGRTDWKREKEWRFRGDLALDGIDRRDLIALVPGPSAAEELRRSIGEEIAVHELFR
jgi:hypothetical protein